MERQYSLKFSSSISKADITETLQESFGHRMKYAKTDKIEFPEGIMIRQYFSHFLFFMEVIEFTLHKDLGATYMVNESSLILFFMLAGKIELYDPDGISIITAEKNICYLSYNKVRAYGYTLNAGVHRFCYLSPRVEWIIKNLNQYPRLKPFMESMENGDKLYEHMFACTMNNTLDDHLMELINLDKNQSDDLETLQSQIAKKLISEYQRLIDIKLSQAAYLAMVYIDKNYFDCELSVAKLADQLCTTVPTLIKQFKKEYKITPGVYLIQVRLKQARRLLTDDKIHVNEVYILVGYKDVHSFSVQFKKFFSYPPSDCY